MKKIVCVLFLLFGSVCTVNATTLPFGGASDNVDGTYTAYWDSSQNGGVYNFITKNLSEQIYDNGQRHNQCKIFLRFNDMFGSGSDQVPYGRTILSATLTLYKYSNMGDNLWHDVFPVTSDWDELTLVYTTPITTGFKTSGFKSPSGQATVDIDLTNLVQSWSDGTVNYGIMIRQRYDYNTSVFWASDDYGDTSLRPTLLVEFEGAANPSGGENAVPEPLSIVLISIACVAARLKLRR